MVWEVACRFGIEHGTLVVVLGGVVAREVPAESAPLGVGVPGGVVVRGEPAEPAPLGVVVPPPVGARVVVTVPTSCARAAAAVGVVLAPTVNGWSLREPQAATVTPAIAIRPTAAHRARRRSLVPAERLTPT